MIAVRVDGRPVPTPAEPAELAALRGTGLLWVNASECGEDDVQWLGRALGLHPLEVEDLVNRNQRPKVEPYGDHLFIVLISAMRPPGAPDLGLVETHLLVGEGWLASISDTEIPALSGLAEQTARRPEIQGGESGQLLYRICDALVDSYFPLLDELDNQVDELETAILTDPGPEAVARIFGLKRALGTLRRVIGPQRDLFQALAGPHGPRLGEETQLYLRDVYDHSVRISEQVETYRDAVSGALDVYLSSVSNRLGEQSRRLTQVATIFLPLSFLTGFFGMNFAVFVNFISGPAQFWGAMGLMALSVPAVYGVSQRLARTAKPIPEARPGRSALSILPRLPTRLARMPVDLRDLPLASRLRRGRSAPGGGDDGTRTDGGSAERAGERTRRAEDDATKPRDGDGGRGR